MKFSFFFSTPDFFPFTPRHNSRETHHGTNDIASLCVFFLFHSFLAHFFTSVCLFWFRLVLLFSSGDIRFFLSCAPPLVVLALPLVLARMEMHVFDGGGEKLTANFSTASQGKTDENFVFWILEYVLMQWRVSGEWWFWQHDGLV